MRRRKELQTVLRCRKTKKTDVVFAHWLDIQLRRYMKRCSQPETRKQHFEVNGKRYTVDSAVFLIGCVVKRYLETVTTKNTTEKEVTRAKRLYEIALQVWSKLVFYL